MGILFLYISHGRFGIRVEVYSLENSLKNLNEAYAVQSLPLPQYNA
jgi:hypothetical protein